MNINLTGPKAWGLAGISFIAGIGLIAGSTMLFGKGGVLGLTTFIPGIMLYGGGSAFGVHKWSQFLMREKEETLKKIRAFENRIPLTDLARSNY